MKLLRLFLLWSCILFFMAPPVPNAFPEDAAPASESKGAEVQETPHIGAIPTYVQKKIYKKIWKQKKLNFSLESASIGDVDGDGMNELIGTDGRRLSMVQWRYGEFHPIFSSVQEGKRGFFSSRLWSREDSGRAMETINKLNKGIHYLSLSAEDLDGDGRDEILFTGIEDHEVVSGIIAYEKGGFQLYKADAGLYLKVFHGEDGRPVLAGQDLHSVKKETYHYLWDGNAVKKGESMELPEGVDIFNAESYLTGDPAGAAYVTLSHAEGLRFFSSDLKETAKGVSIGEIKQSSFRVHTGDDQGKSGGKRVRIPQKFLSGDFDKDGMDEVLLIVDRPLADIWGVRHLLKRNRVADMILANGHVAEFWDTEPISGKILDLTVGDVDNNGKDDLVLILGDGWHPFAGGTKILIYEF
ncbi:MAG: hypothetical protein COW52_07025 [Nitrospirae bacterium CG17_big_fil_post_rev_8_21_14_2_50_50_9]|nr:MAG: hypothetical protein COW52_07025 [Nitrospirae bacterium CG17_big_fil_post_rev_8_21_14_2_50_50_9]